MLNCLMEMKSEKSYFLENVATSTCRANLETLASICTSNTTKLGLATLRLKIIIKVL